MTTIVLITLPAFLWLSIFWFSSSEPNHTTTKSISDGDKQRQLSYDTHEYYKRNGIDVSNYPY